MPMFRRLVIPSRIIVVNMSKGTPTINNPPKMPAPVTGETTPRMIAGAISTSNKIHAEGFLAVGIW